jgi:hypothetical protein
LTIRLAGAIGAAAFALGILTGVAGTIVARDPAPGATFATVMAEHMSGRGTAGMMSMMGGWMGPGVSGMPWGLHEQHHPAATPEASK